MLEQVEGTTEGVGPDRVDRLYAFTPLWNSEDSKVILSVGIPKQVAFADADYHLRINLLIWALVTTAALIAAWLLGEIYILRPTQELVQTTQRLAQGDLSARTRLTFESGELGALAHSINHLGEALTERERQQAQAQKEIRDYANELERRNRELRDFVDIASHDMHEPLRKIQIFSDLLVTRYNQSFDERGHYYLTNVSKAANHMQQLIVDLLHYSRVTAARRPFTEVDLNQVMERVLSNLEFQIQTHQASIEVGQLPTIEADETLMAQLFQNLIGNAIKFHAPEQHPKVTVSANVLSSLPALCQITVSDDGIGFDEKYLERMFQPFERLHSKQDFEGTGMGLAICRKIVERHQGAITAHSAPGQGASFIVTIPIRQPKEEKS
jgi:signal transduction histidine kinase